MRAADVEFALLVALVIIVAFALARAQWRTGRYEGHWTDSAGGVFGVSREAAGGLAIQAEGPRAGARAGPAKTKLFRRLCAANGECARLTFDGRYLVWPGGDRWHKNGVF